MKSVTLKDLEIRYQNLRKQFPKLKKCSVSNCNNPRDITPSLGKGASCAYHRLLFDYWTCDVLEDMEKIYHYMESQKGRRRAFTNWRNRTGKKTCDEIVLKLSQEGINWEC